MSKAGNMFRRSGVVLKSYASPHTDLQLLINQLKDSRAQFKAFTSSNSATNQDMMKWAEQEENKAIKETVARVSELLVFYTEVQKNFSDRLKEFHNQFEMILEGERIVAKAKSQLETAQEKETRARKEMKRLSKRKDLNPELRDLTQKLEQAEKEKDISQVDLNERLREHEAVKMIRLKNGLVKWSLAHKEFAEKSHIIFSATHDISQLIPDVPNSTNIQEIRYTGGAAALRISMETKEILQQPSSQLGRRSLSTSQIPAPEELPPPYAELQPPVNPYLSSCSPDGATGGSYQYSSSLNSSYQTYPNSANASSQESSFHNTSYQNQNGSFQNLNSSFAYNPNPAANDTYEMRRRSDHNQFQSRQSGSDYGMKISELSLSNGQH